MKKLTKDEMKEIKGGGLTGALFEGISSVIDSFTSCITGIGQLAYCFSQDTHNKETITFGKTPSISWDDNPQSVTVNVKSALTTSQPHLSSLDNNEHEQTLFSSHEEHVNDEPILISQHHSEI